MNKMNITSAKYVEDFEGTHISITAIIDGQPIGVPIDSANRHYAEIMKQVENGTITIAPADE